MVSKILNLLISLLIIGIFIYFLNKYSVLQNVKLILGNFNPNLILLSIFFYSLTYIFRALRFKLFFKEVKVIQMFSIICVHTFLNNVLPFRSGESSFPLMLKKLFNTSITSSSTALIIARIFDLIALSFLFLISTLITKTIKGWLIVFPIGMLILLFSLLLLSYRMLYILRKRSQTFKDLFLFVNSYFSRKNTALTAFYSFIIWLSKFISFHLILLAGKFKIGLAKTVFVSTFGEVTTVLPIHSIGGFGTYEAGLVGGFKIAGLNAKTALPVALYFHSVLLLMSAVLALSGWINLLRSKNP